MEYGLPSSLALAVLSNFILASALHNKLKLVLLFHLCNGGAAVLV